MSPRLTASLALLAVVSCAPAAVPERPTPAPSAGGETWGAPGPVRPGQRAEGRSGMVVASHPLAAEAGLEMLRSGGNAVDAAVATAFAVGVLEPMMAGLGGGGALTLWIPAEDRAEHLEFYAAIGATPDYTLEDDSLATPERGVAIPGTVAGLLTAHERWGSLPRRRIMEPAIRLAQEGFVVHSLLARAIAGAGEVLTHAPDAAAIFNPGGEPLRVGDRLEQPALAATLRAVAEGGADAFYSGPLAEEVVGTLRAGGSTLTTDDFAAYQPNDRRPTCTTYRDYVVLTSAPPMGGVTVAETLNLLAPYDFRSMGPPFSSGSSLSVMVDAMRIARADRAHWIGDPDASGVPGSGIASRAFADERRARIGGSAPDTLHAGDPWEEDALPPVAGCARLDPFPAAVLPPPRDAAPGEEGDDAETTHLSVVDASGTAVSLTFTMGRYFGTGAYAAGMFLNSAGYNFGDRGANVRGPYRTANSTITPTIVLDGGRARLVVGSPGSGRIPPAVVHTILYTLDLGYDVAEAVAMPRAYPWTTEPVVQVEDGFDPEALAVLRRRGYELRAHPPMDMYFGGVSAIHLRPDGLLVGVADPRRNGGARGY